MIRSVISMSHLALFILLVTSLACTDQRSGLEKYSPDPLGKPIERETGSFMKPIHWVVDTTHSSLLFRTGHTAVHDVVGWVQSYRIEIEAKRFDFSDAKIRGRFNMGTITMPNPDLAGNVMSENFIRSSAYPIAEYASNGIKYTGINRFTVHGDLSLKGVTQPVDLKVQFNGYANLGHTMPGFTVTGKFSRFDFGLSSRDTLKPGNSPLVDDTIYIAGNFRLGFE